MGTGSSSTQGSLLLRLSVKASDLFHHVPVKSVKLRSLRFVRRVHFLPPHRLVLAETQSTQRVFAVVGTVTIPALFTSRADVKLVLAALYTSQLSVGTQATALGVV